MACLGLCASKKKKIGWVKFITDSSHYKVDLLPSVQIPLVATE